MSSVSKLLCLISFVFICASCDSGTTVAQPDERPITLPPGEDNSGDTDSDSDTPDDTDTDDSDDDTSAGFAPINFSNWKLTLPADNDNNGRPDEYQPNALVNYGYQDIEAIQPYMYDDEEDASLVFHVVPGTTTTNSSYSRSELRELINPSNARENWTLQEGGLMQGRLKMLDISEDTATSREYHRTIIMQIHGIISLEDMETYGFSGNNGPPLVKMTWQDGNIWIFKKSLVDESTEGLDLYDVYGDVWEDEKVNIGYVGFDEFTLSIKASDAKLEIQLNDDTPVIYEDISLQKWPFENYYKAGNYLGSTAEGAFATLKYYDLTVTH